MRGHLGYTVLVTDKAVYERFQEDDVDGQYK
jgi:hypothetical protein